MSEQAKQHLNTCDPVLGQIIDRIGPHQLTVRQPTFETLVRSIAFQQLSGKVAAVIFARLKAAARPRFTAPAILRLTDDQLRACGLSRQKIASIRDLAERSVGRQIVFGRLHRLTDEEVLAQLSQVRGVGVWTAQMFLLFALERPNVMPLTDLGVRNAVRKAYGLEAMPTTAEMVALAEKWTPFCSIATWYLWRSLDGSAEI